MKMGASSVTLSTYASFPVVEGSGAVHILNTIYIAFYIQMLSP